MAIVVGVGAPVAGLAGLPPVHWLTHPAVQTGAAGLAVAGIALTALAQFAMGDSWRVGVDANERTALVTNGPFAIVRNPMSRQLARYALLPRSAVPVRLETAREG